MPIPVSATTISTLSCSRCALSSTRPADGVNLTAMGPQKAPPFPRSATTPRLKVHPLRCLSHDAKTQSSPPVYPSIPIYAL